MTVKTSVLWKIYTHMAKKWPGIVIQRTFIKGHSLYTDFASLKQKDIYIPENKIHLHTWKKKTFTSLKRKDIYIPEKKTFTSLKLFEIFVPETFTSQKSKQPIDKNHLYNFGCAFIFQLMNHFFKISK